MAYIAVEREGQRAGSSLIGIHAVVRRCPLKADSIEAGAAVVGVVARPADQEIVAGVAVQRVIAIAADEGVVAVAARQRRTVRGPRDAGSVEEIDAAAAVHGDG